jgi:NADH-quinone oxidoreductase subunit A
MHTWWLIAAAQTPPPAPPTGEFNLDWMAVGVFISICVGNALLLGNISKLLGPNRPTANKLTPYESGMPPIGPAQQRYTVRYYIVAMLFVVFDIEAVFLYPWAIAFDAIGIYGLIEMLLFILLLVVGYLYAWRKGALDWAS